MRERNAKMYENSYYGAAQAPKPKWYNPNRFNAADAAVAYVLSAVGLLVLQFAVVDYFAYLSEVELAIDIVFTLISQAFMLGLALLMGKKKKVNLVRGGGMYLDGNRSYFLLVVLCFFIAMTLFAPVTDVVEAFFFTPEELGTMQLQGDGSLILMLYVLAIVCPAVGEEFLFRGVIANGLREYGKGTAVLLSSLMFSLMHTNPLQTVYQFLIGILLGFLYVETKSLLPSMLLHAMNNGLSGLSALVYDITNPTLKIAYYVITVLLGLSALAWLIVATVRKGKTQNKFLLALYPPRSPYAEEMQKQNGRYYAAIKTAHAQGFTDETVTFDREQSLKDPFQGKWFYHENYGWQPFNTKGSKGKFIPWTIVAFVVNTAMWILVLASIKGWLVL